MALPIDFENELQVAGAILRAPECMDQLVGRICFDDFDSELAKAIWLSAEQLMDEGHTVTSSELAQHAGLTDEEYHRVLDLVPTAVNVQAYAALVVQTAQRRRMMELGDKLAQATSANAGELLSEAYEFFSAAIEKKVTSRAMTSKEMCLELYELMAAVDEGRPMAQSSGYHELDNLLGGGFALSGFYILAARPGIGKTTLALNIAERVKGAVLFISMEMSPMQIAAKRMALYSGVPVSRVLRKRSETIVTDEVEMEKMAACTTALCRSQMIINREPDLSVAEIGALARGIKDLKLIVIDYLGLIEPGDTKVSRYEQVTQISRALKLLAIRMNMPILCLAQLNRASEQRSNKRPSLSDLRDSGAIEQDADGVLLLHRPTYNSQNGETKEDGPVLLECCLVKNRHGRTGKVDFDVYLDTGIVEAIHWGD